MRFAPDRIDILCGWPYRLSIVILLSAFALPAQPQNRCSASGRMGGEKFTANNCAAALYGKSVAIWFNANPISVQEVVEFQASAEVPDKKEGKQRTLVLIKFCPGGGATKASATAVKVIDLHTNHAKSPLYGIQWTVKSPRDFKAGRSPTANLLAQVVTQGMRSGELRQDDVWEIVFEMGAMSHGLIMLYLGGRIDTTPARFRALYRRSFRRYIHGIHS